MDRTRASRRVYCSADPNLALGVLWRATGEHPMDLFDRLLGEPLQIDRYAWSVSPAGSPTAAAARAPAARLHEAGAADAERRDLIFHCTRQVAGLLRWASERHLEHCASAAE